MQHKKDEFARDVIRIIYDVCKMVFNLHADSDIKKIFGIGNEKMASIVSKIVNTLPDKFFTTERPQSLEEIKNIFAKEFIFFQVQENCDDPRYQEDLSQFINIFTRDIQKRVDMLENQKCS